jgi:hypothetical protein
MTPPPTGSATGADLRHMVAAQSALCSVCSVAWGWNDTASLRVSRQYGAPLVGVFMTEDGQCFDEMNRNLWQASACLACHALSAETLLPAYHLAANLDSASHIMPFRSYSM